jgi:hypothetical protein
LKLLWSDKFHEFWSRVSDLDGRAELSWLRVWISAVLRVLNWIGWKGLVFSRMVNLKE